jgi:SAM-dependent methyltransferase
VIVSDVKDNHAHGYLDWYIEGNFRNSNFAKNELDEGVAEGFNSKQEVIAHFVRQGKSAASGAAAWERGWRGSQPKKKKLQPPVRSYHDDLDDKRYGTDVDEAYEPKYWHQNPEAVKKAHDWRETETGTDVRMYQGYKMKFTPDALLIYKGGDLVDKRPGNFSNPTNGNIVTGKRLIGMHIQKQKQSQPIDEDAAGVGVVKGGKDPRYMTATMGDDNDVTPDTLNQMMRGYNLVAKKPAARHQKTVKSTVGKGMNEDLPPPEAARKTQIKGTLPTYLKARDVLDKSGVEGPALDFGAGAGHGTEHLGPDAKSYEPFPQGNFTPHYVDVSKIPSNAFKKIVNLNVLNVVPNVEGNRIRDSIVQNIGRVLAPGGIAIITTRGKDVLTIKGQAGPEPTSMISSIGTYQKGFTSKELLGYIQGVLGSGFEVATLKLGPAGVTIRKLQASVDESEHDFSPMSWSARELGRKPTPHRMDMQPHERDDHDFRREMDSIKHEFAKLYGEPEATKYNVAEDAGGTGAGAMATSMGGGNGFGWSVFYKGLQQRRKKVNK